MSKHVLGSLKFSGGILSIYCLGLAIVPTASAAPATNISNATGTNISNATGFSINNFNSFAPANASVSGGNGGTVATGDAGGTVATGDAGGTVATGDTGSKGAKSNTIFGINRQANIRAAQLLQSQLDAAQSSYDSASARVSQLLAAAPTPATTPDNPKLSAVRFARLASQPGECGCNNPDVAVKPADNSAAELAAKELATAKEAQAKAATELAEAQAQARQFLASAKKAPQVSAQSTFSPVW